MNKFDKVLLGLIAISLAITVFSQSLAVSFCSYLAILIFVVLILRKRL